MNDLQRKPRIALISTGLGHIKRGVETWTDDLGAELFRRGYPVTVYKGGGKPDKPYEKVIGCVRRRTALSEWIVRHSPKIFWRFCLTSPYGLEQMTFDWNILPEMILKQYDIIHTQDPQAADFFRKAAKCGLIRSKVLLANGTDEPLEFLAKFEYLQHLAPYYAQEMRDQGFQQRRWFAIGNFVDTDMFKPGDAAALRREFGIPSDAFVVLSVAAVTARNKRMDVLIREARAMNNDKAFLLIAGATEADTPDIKALAQELLPGRHKILCDVPYTDIPRIHALADVFVLCSLKEVFGIVTLEAMACGIPAVVHHYPVSAWIVGDGGDAVDMTVDRRAAKVLNEYVDAGYRRMKGDLARKRVVRYFSKQAVVDQMETMYTEVWRD